LLWTKFVLGDLGIVGHLEAGNSTAGAVGGRLLHVVVARHDGILIYFTMDPGNPEVIYQ